MFQSYFLAQGTKSYSSITSLSQEKEIIAYPADISVLEDECYVISDIKDQKILIYDRNGHFLKSWKALGQGPGEYQGMWWIDYYKPYLGICDIRSRKLLLYERIGTEDFEWIEDIYQHEGYLNNFKLEKNEIFFDVPVLYKNKYYFIHGIDIETKQGKYYLPAGVRYGLHPGDDYKKPDGEYRIIWGRPKSFIDAFNGFIYSTWTGDLNIIKIDIDSGSWTMIGRKTKNYTQPKTWNVSRVDYKKTALWKKKNESKFSWTVGVFVDKNIIGLIYLNSFGDGSKKAPILQRYDGQGRFLGEMQLEGSQVEYNTLIHCYSRINGFLYVLNTKELEAGEAEFEILKYQVRK